MSDENEFIDWSGGECPVDKDTIVNVRLWAGDVIVNRKAGEFDWQHNSFGMGGDIIAYRLVEAEEKPKAARDTQVGGDHYKTAVVQPWDVVDTWHIEQQIGFYRGNVLKYTMRMGKKDDDLTEIRKAAHYLQKLVEVLEQKGGV